MRAWRTARRLGNLLAITLEDAFLARDPGQGQSDRVDEVVARALVERGGARARVGPGVQALPPAPVQFARNLVRDGVRELPAARNSEGTAPGPATLL